MTRLALAALTLSIGSATAQTDNCEPLRAQIEAKIRAAGVTSLSVTVVDAAASAPGRVVGSCDRGARKILYLQTPGQPGARPRPAARDEALLTECKDGTVKVGGDCRR